MKRIYLIDCPGVVPPSQSDTDSDLLLRGVVRVENVEYPAQYAHAALEKCERRHIERTYGISGWNDADEFLEKLAAKGGRLLKGGERDLDGVAKMFLNDFLRGKVPWFVKPPGWAEAPPRKKDGTGAEAEQAQDGGTRGDVTKLNKQATVNARKRKRDDDDGDDVIVDAAKTAEEGVPESAEDVDDEFGSLSSDEAEGSETDKDGSDDDEGSNDDEGSTPEPEDVGDDEGGAKLI